MFKRDMIRKAGAILEKYNLEPLNRISTRLTRDFKGYVSRLWVQKTVEPRWKRSYTTPAGHGPWPKGSRKHINMLSEPSMEPLTPQEKKYVKSHEDEIERDKHVTALIQLWTGKDIAEQAQVKIRSPRGSNEDRTLLEASKEHMLELSKQMTDSTVIWTFNSLRTLATLANGFGDILYEEAELRERKKGLNSV